MRSWTPRGLCPNVHELWLSVGVLPRSVLDLSRGRLFHDARPHRDGPSRRFRDVSAAFLCVSLGILIKVSLFCKLEMEPWTSISPSSSCDPEPGRTEIHQLENKLPATKTELGKLAVSRYRFS